MAISVMTWVWNHSRSRHGARLVLLAIADCASGDGGNAWPSNAELRRKSGLGERAVQASLAELVKLGELEVRYNEGPKGCNRYRVVMNDTPAESAPPQKLRGPDGRKPKSSQAKTDNPAESAPPQISQEPPQNLHPTPAESAPVTVLEPKANRQQKKTSSSSRRERGTRIPDDFEVTPEMADWARGKVSRLIAAGRGQSETERFIDHWRQSSTPTAWKLDWVAAWRNWLRTEEVKLGSAPQQGAQPPKSTTNDRVQQAIEAGKRVQAMLNGES
ncbi:MAG: helix-turn-helix domain-containing protein [Actinocrinis sp.]